MAEGTSAPNYRLSQGTQRRVYEAGLGGNGPGGDARKHLQNAAKVLVLGDGLQPALAILEGTDVLQGLGNSE